MSEDIIKIIITYGGGTFAIISFIVVAAVYFGSWKEKMKGVDKLSDNVYKLTKSIYKIEVTVETLSQRSNPLVDKNSPLGLTDNGKEIVKDLNLEKTLTAH